MSSAAGIPRCTAQVERPDDRVCPTAWRARGQASMRHGFPEFGHESDAILFVSGDFGYLMDPAVGPELRLRTLDSAHEHLSAGGRVVLELISRDPRTSDRGADVFYFSRAPIVRDKDGTELFHGPETWQYIKTFSKQEFASLIEASRFDLSAATFRYVVRDSSDALRIGHVVDDAAITTEESYRLLVSLMR